MKVIVNGERRELPSIGTVAEAVAIAVGEADRALGDSSSQGLAVAVDGEVVPRSEWTERELEDGQRVEVLRAVQGGR